MAEEFRRATTSPGRATGATAEGTVERKITEDTEASGRTVRASEDDPQYEVAATRAAGTAVHKPGALHED